MGPVQLRFALAAALACACPAGVSADPGPGEWARAPLAAGVRDALAPVVERAFTPEEGVGESRALVVVHGGQLVLESYAPGYDADTRHVSWSMAKSITHALVGRLVARGLVDIDDPMPSPFPEGDARADITWRHWLTMSDGLDYTEIAEPGVELPLSEQDVVQMMYGPGRFDVVAWIVENCPPLRAPGERFNYSTAGYHLIARAVQEVAGTTGDPAATSAWLERELFGPLGMDAVAEYDAAGTLLGGSLVYASARDFARFGQLYLQDGVWDGERLLPEGWTDFARRDDVDDGLNIYGAGFWLSPEVASPATQQMDPPFDAFHAGGHEGQTIWVVPSRDLVVVRTGLMPNSPETWSALFALNQRIARAFPEATSPSVSP